MNCYLQNYTTYQSTYFIDYFIQGIIKNPKIMKIHQVHQKLQVKQFFIILLDLFSVCVAFKFQVTQIFR